MANFRYSDPLLQTRLESQSSQPHVSQLEPPNAGSGLALTHPMLLQYLVLSLCVIVLNDNFYEHSMALGTFEPE